MENNAILNQLLPLYKGRQRAIRDIVEEGMELPHLQWSRASYD